MQTFAERLRFAMAEADMKQIELSRRSGAPRSAISQYLSGKMVPSEERIHILADVTGVSFDFLSGRVDPPREGKPIPARKISVQDAACCMGKSSQFVRIGLQSGRLPFGSAVPTSDTRWSYYINPFRFREYVGVDQFNEYFGLSLKQEQNGGMPCVTM